MKLKNQRGALRFPLSLLHYGNSYYIDRIADLEKVLARQPRQLQLDLVGEGEIPADWALLLRALLSGRSPKTRLITHAWSSLQNGSVLVWLLGEQRLIRADARLFFRRANGVDDEDKTWTEAAAKAFATDDAVDLEEADHAKILHLINEFLPVKELAGKVIEVPVLRQFGLVENEQLDQFLATAFGPTPRASATATAKPKRSRAKAKVTATVTTQK